MMAIQWNSHPHLVLLLLFLLFFLFFLLSLSCLQLIDSFLKLLQPYFPRCEICEMLLWCLQKLGIHKMVPFISVGHWSPHFWIRHSWGIHPPNKNGSVTIQNFWITWTADCTCNLLGVVFCHTQILDMQLELQWTPNWPICLRGPNSLAFSSSSAYKCISE